MRSFVPGAGYSEVEDVPVLKNLGTALVNGGAGFLGSHLCERLLLRGHSVICLDNFSTGRRVNVDHLQSNPRFRIIEHDVRQPFDIAASLIFNFASPASPPDYQRDPVGTLLTNVLGAVNTLDCARKTGAIVVQSSTSEVYGDPTQSPQRETYCGNVNPIGPRACYDEGKRSAETLFFDYHRTYGLDIKVGRIFNTYGPRMRLDDGRVVSNFIVQALRNADLTIYGDGQQTRSFCYVDDLVEGFLRFSAAGSACHGPINLGNPGEFTVRRLAEIIRDLTNSRSRIVHLPAVVDDPRQRRPDISRAMTELGWQPQIELEAGLARTVEYFDGLLARTERAEAV
ncbi:NAD-dependent epimerase/dehydratase family protein [Rhizobium phaseoli]|uniref:UDP-glucuronic acid decarboxylase family protein n=1 Tax=Rhizobium phaseoli TaxID=396 RepID=UPI0004D6B95D|nr:UDP-glucuronic acid decarboxylase family protein [Rhizobium phaseoli]KEC71968.1 dTDP-glucose 4,6-dehydratase [Rhizobium leguminosarum bv. phaseoli CCGM1]ANL25960.1 NAD-dependent epimerase/dehydratase family protein [Rhizobium phaseoli]ANL32196.1 NAD-dependent epimerase/dehydratase family protein [Rhizobium phaseoli]ANL95927.1 NAD-dependent epimerase/dehydratase family protein [Rhizobium phaseoli]PWI56086.1 NAD-dependent dehydratase [Rhizobium phaseoli]